MGVGVQGVSTMVGALPTLQPYPVTPAASLESMCQPFAYLWCLIILDPGAELGRALHPWVSQRPQSQWPHTDAGQQDGMRGHLAELVSRAPWGSPCPGAHFTLQGRVSPTQTPRGPAS